MKIIPSSQKNRYIARVVIVLAAIALIVWLVSWLSAPSSEIRDWSEIRTWHDLDAVRDNLAGNYTLMNDLDSTTAGYTELASPTANGGKGWQPIGYYGTCSSGSDPRVADAKWNGLRGTFDGQGYEIKDLFINCPSNHDLGAYNVGLFGRVNVGGIVKNVRVSNATVTGKTTVGGLVGFNYGTVSNSYFSGNVTGNERVGGLVGRNADTVSNSCATGSVNGDSMIGALVGYNERGTVSNSHYNYDEFLINGQSMITIGALFDEDFEEWLANDKFLDINDRLSQENGYYVVNNVADFKELVAFGQDNSLKFRLKSDLDLAAEPNLYIPYFAGEFDGNGHKISNLSFNSGSICHIGLFGYIAPDGKVSQVYVENVKITGARFVGGLAGANRGTVSNSYSTGSVTGERLVGGLVGDNRGTVSNSYSIGSVTGKRIKDSLVRHSGKNQHGGPISNSYSSGSVTGYEYVGSLVGSNDGGTVTNSFWDTETSGKATSAGGTGKTTAEMQDIATFS